MAEKAAAVPLEEVPVEQEADSEGSARSSDASRRAYACCDGDGQWSAWQCNGTCRKAGGGLWFHLGCARGKKHGHHVAPHGQECYRAAEVR